MDTWWWRQFLFQDHFKECLKTLVSTFHLMTQVDINVILSLLLTKCEERWNEACVDLCLNRKHPIFMNDLWYPKAVLKILKYIRIAYKYRIHSRDLAPRRASLRVSDFSARPLKEGRDGERRGGEGKGRKHSRVLNVRRGRHGSGETYPLQRVVGTHQAPAEAPMCVSDTVVPRR